MGESASPAHRDEESSPAAAAAAATAAATTQPATAAAQQGGQAPDEQAKDTEQGDESDSGCPICRYIEAGPCGQEHKVWVACRQEAKKDGVDFVQHCADQFRTFFGCMLQNEHYYQPFLEAFHVDVDKSQQAISKANEQAGQHQQQQPGGQQLSAAQQEQHGIRHSADP